MYVCRKSSVRQCPMVWSPRPSLEFRSLDLKRRKRRIFSCCLPPSLRITFSLLLLFYTFLSTFICTHASNLPPLSALKSYHLPPLACVCFSIMKSFERYYIQNLSYTTIPCHVGIGMEREMVGKGACWIGSVGWPILSPFLGRSIFWLPSSFCTIV